MGDCDRYCFQDTADKPVAPKHRKSYFGIILGTEYHFPPEAPSSLLSSIQRVSVVKLTGTSYHISTNFQNEKSIQFFPEFRAQSRTSLEFGQHRLSPKPTLVLHNREKLTHEKHASNLFQKVTHKKVFLEIFPVRPAVMLV